jgi:transcriptional regulator GlxA family with amidase domain
VPEQRWVEDGKFITSAGVSAGIDMALHLTERLTDEATARMVQLGIEYDPKPPHAASNGTPWTGTSTPRSWSSSSEPLSTTSRSCLPS